MLAEPSDSAPLPFKDAEVSGEIAWPGRLLLLALNFIPLIHVGAVCWALWTGRILIAVAAIYLAPPLLARLALAAGKFEKPQMDIGSRAFFQWWALFQLQILFCRLPALEEILRLVPGLYSMWLRIWGARIGRLAYWAPGTFISDRSFLDVGDDVALGAGVRLVPHLIHKNAAGKLQLSLAKIQIGDRVIVGGFSILSAGTILLPGQSTRAALLSPPFTTWKDGKRVHHA